MEVGREEEEEIEIVSMGALHRGGPWEKKYWSCSRGKDRYPYPVGYQVVRYHLGNSCKMEIQEGSKGPLFLVTSTDGDSSTGQTPDIAWKNFQKKSGPKVRNWHGRRFSCRIDGVELFGFRNPAVQRLLCELVVDSNGAIETNLPCPSTCNAALQLDHKVETEGSDVHQDLPVCSGKSRSTGKRSMKPGQEEGSAKRIHCQDLMTSIDNCLVNEDLDNLAHQVSPIEGGPGNAMEFMDVNNCSTSNCMPPMPEEVSCILKCTPDNDNLGGLVRDSFQQVGLSSGSSNPSSEKSDLDSAEQELAKSMMAFFLPQAIPLLRKTYGRRRSKQKGKVDLECSVSTEANNTAFVGNDHPSGDNCQGVGAPKRFAKGSEEDNSQTYVQVKPLCEMVKAKCTKDDCMNDEPVFNLEEVRAVVADSFEDDAQILDASTHKPLPAYHREFDDACSSELNRNTSKLPLSTKGEDAEPSKCLLETCDGISIDVPNNHQKVECVLSDSLLVCLEEEFGEKDSSCPDPSNQGNNCVEHMQVPYPSFSRHDGVQQFNGPINGTDKDSSIPMDMPKHKNLGNDLTELCAQAPKIHERRVSSSGEFLANVREQSYGSSVVSNDLNCTVLQDLVNSDVHNETEKQDAYIVNSGSMAANTGQAKSCLLSMPNEALPTELSSGDHKENKFCSAHHSSRNDDIPLSESIVCRNFDDTEFIDKYVASESSDKRRNCKAGSKSDNTNTIMSVDNGMKAAKHNLPDKGEKCQAGYTNGNEKTGMSVCGEINVCEHIPPLDNLDIIYPSEQAVLASTRTSQDMVKNVSGNMKSAESHIISCSYFEDNYTGNSQKAHNYGMMPLKETRTVAQQRRNAIPRAFPCSDGKPVADSKRGNNYEDEYHDHALSHINHLNGLPSKDTEPLARESNSDLELMGCYFHPTPVLSIMLTTKDSCLQISVLCGFLENCERFLYMYNISPKEQQETPPSFIGYTSLLLPSLEQSSKGNFSFGRSGLQFTPDGQFLVLLSSIKTPSCRTQSIYCSCSLCKLDQCQDNAVKVVSVNFGYVSLLTKLMAYGKLSCILVCEPNYIIAVEDRGNLHVWMMNFGWSAISEEYMITRSGYVGPSVLELRGMPKCNSLVIGHNGIGGFCLWDISKRMLLATFAAPGNIVFQILPVGFCSLQKDIIHASLDNIEESLQAMTMKDRPSKTSRQSFLMSSGEDVAIWLLVSAASVAEFQHDLQATEPNTRWRLALLAKKTVLMGNVLDPRASAIDASGNYGFAGTYEGLLYRWELSSGRKLAGTQCFKCGRVSCIAVDAKSGAMAVADDKCQLLLYTQNKKDGSSLSNISAYRLVSSISAQ